VAKFQMGVNIVESEKFTSRLGSDTIANSGNLVDADIKKLLKYVGESRYGLCSAGDPIEASMVSLESASVDGYTIGTIAKKGRLAVVCDGLQATPGTGTIAVGDYVVTGTVVAAGTALGTLVGPKVTKATYQPSAAALVAGAGKTVLSFPIDLANITDGDVVTTFTPGFAFELVGMSFVTNTPVTTADKLSTLNVEIGTTDTTGGVVSLTSATATPLGAVIAGTDFTALNVGTATDTISIKASSTTAFAEGSGTIQVTLKNLDIVNAVAPIKGTLAEIPGWRVLSLGVGGAVGDTAVIGWTA